MITTVRAGPNQTSLSSIDWKQGKLNPLGGAVAHWSTAASRIPMLIRSGELPVSQERHRGSGLVVGDIPVGDAPLLKEALVGPVILERLEGRFEGVEDGAVALADRDPLRCHLDRRARD